MANTGITIYDGYMSIGIDENGCLIFEKDVNIDNIDFDLENDNLKWSAENGS